MSIFFLANISCARAQMKLVTSTNDNFWLERTVNPAENSSSNNTILIDTSKEFQVIDGFGGCFNETGYEALQLVDEDQQEQIMKSLFDASGTDFNICRMSIGANDFSLDWYSLNETINDFEMTGFNIERDKKRLIPYIKSAQKYQAELKVWGSPWSPPIWMKHNRHYGGKATNMDWGPLYGDNMKEIYENNRFITEDKYYKSYALYFSKYIQSYKEQGINIYSVHPQNEVFANQLFPSCIWAAEDLSEFTNKYLIPKLKTDHPKVEVYYGTLNNDSIAYVDALMKNTKVKGVGVQWYGIKTIGAIHEKYPDLKIMQTESECNNGLNNWFTAEHTFDLMYSSFKNGANSYMYWNMILNEMGLSTWMWRQNSMITIDRFSKKVSYNPEFYIMKHFSHYVKSGAHLIEIKEEKMNLKTLAFKNTDGSIVVLIGNTTDQKIQTNLKVGDRIYELNLAAHSISTGVVE